MSERFSDFRSFYPFYLSEHSNRTCRRLHFVGSALLLVVLALIVFAVLRPWWLFSLPVIAYGFAWFGHFVFEKNRPATFSYPVWSFLGDWMMFKDILVGKIRF